MRLFKNGSANVGILAPSYASIIGTSDLSSLGASAAVDPTVFLREVFGIDSLVE